MRIAIPDKLLKSLHTRRTSTRIHVVNKDRGHPNADVFQASSDSIDGLEEVVASNDTVLPFDEIKDVFLLKHGRSLKRLRVSHGATAQGWRKQMCKA
jgi:hypothetical protein